MQSYFPLIIPLPLKMPFLTFAFSAKFNSPTMASQRVDDFLDTLDVYVDKLKTALDISTKGE